MDGEVRKGALRLIRQWRDWNRNNRPKGFEDRAYASCARQLETMLANEGRHPNEEHWLDRFMEVVNGEVDPGYENHREKMRAMMRGFRWDVIKREHLPDLYEAPENHN
jgi:hypothetical protein